MAIQFQDRSEVASLLKNEFNDAIVNIFRSYRAGLEKKEDKQFKEEATIARDNAGHIERNIKSLNIGTATDQDIANVRTGIETLRTSYKDNVVLQSSANLLDLELNSFEKLYNKRKETIENLDDFLLIADKKIRDPYQKTSGEDGDSNINGLIDDIKKSYDSKYNYLNINDQKFYSDKITKAFEYLNAAQKLSKMDVSPDAGLQLDEGLTKLGFRDGQLSSPDAFQSNLYQTTIKQAAKSFANNDYDEAIGMFRDANQLEVIEDSRAKDINAVLSIYYNDDGTIRDKWDKEVMFDNPLSGIREPRQMTDLLNTGLSLAKQGQLKQSQIYLNMIPQDIEDMKKQNIAAIDDMVDQTYIKYDEDIMGQINKINEIDFSGRTIQPAINLIKDTDNRKLVTTGFNKIKQTDKIDSKSKAVTSSQIKDLQEETAEAIAMFVQAGHDPKMTEKLRNHVEEYRNTKVGSKAHIKAANKIAYYMKNNPEDVNKFDFGCPLTLELRNPDMDIVLRNELLDVFKKYGYYADLYKTTYAREKFKESQTTK